MGIIIGRSLTPLNSSRNAAGRPRRRERVRGSDDNSRREVQNVREGSSAGICRRAGGNGKRDAERNESPGSALSAWLFARQAQAGKEIQLSHFSFSSLDPNSGGAPVDLDPLEVSWQSSGEPEDMIAYLENVQSQARTSAVNVPATEHTVRFQPDPYRSILVNRHRGDTNRIRAVLQSKKAAFVSEVLDLPVGLTVLTVVDSSAQLTVAAMIDNTRIPNYDFQAKIVVPWRSETAKFLSIGPSIPYRFIPQRISHPKQLDWSSRGVYFGPDDPHLVRFQFLVDNSLNP